MKTQTNNMLPKPDSYLIYSDAKGWFLKINGEKLLGPFNSYGEAERNAKLFCALSNELKDVA